MINIYFKRRDETKTKEGKRSKGDGEVKNEKVTSWNKGERKKCSALTP